MRCHQARLRLTGSRRDKSLGADDRALLEHLKSCPACAKEAAAAAKLMEALATTRVDDMENVRPLNQQRKEVEAMVSAGAKRRRPGWLSKSTETGIPGWRPAFGIGAAVLAILIAAITLVPFRYDRTVGFEVAFAGVDPELVEEDERICDMLFDLGLPEAAVDLLGCETTCRLTVFDLKSEEEVALVVAAFNDVNPTGLSTSVVPVRSTISGSLFDRANKTIGL